VRLDLVAYQLQRHRAGADRGRLEASLLPSGADLLHSAANAFETGLELVQSETFRGGNGACRAGYEADLLFSAANAPASGQVPRPSELTLLQTEPDLLLSAPILSQSGQDLGGQVLGRVLEEKVRHRAMKVRVVSDPFGCRSGEAKIQLRKVQLGSSKVRVRRKEVRSNSRRVRSKTRRVGFRTATLRLRCAAAKYSGIAGDSLELGLVEMTLEARARVAPVGHLVSLSDGTVRVPNFRRTIFGSAYDFVGPPHATPRSREMARGSETTRRKGTMSGNSPSFVMRRR
jgi:hypothetical protein